MNESKEAKSNIEGFSDGRVRVDVGKRFEACEVCFVNCGCQDDGRVMARRGVGNGQIPMFGPVQSTCWDTFSSLVSKSLLDRWVGEDVVHDEIGMEQVQEG